MRFFPRTLLAALLLCAVPAGARAQEGIRIALASLPPGNGNPFTSTARTSWYTYRAVFDTLAQLGADMAPEPALAASWRNAGDRTWIVTLREGVVFSNGEPFDAEAVLFSYDYLRGPDGATEALARETAGIAGIRALDPLTVEFTTKDPDPHFPRLLTVIPMVPPAYWRGVGAAGFSRAPVGTGPFLVDSWNDARIRFKAFGGSWRAPKAPALELVALADTAGRVQALLSGRVDIASEIGPEGAAILADAGFSVYQRPASSVRVIAFNTLKPGSPFADARVRQAMNYAVNRDAMAAVILDGLVPPASQVTPRGNPEYNAELRPYPYDPEKARALLAEAGYPDGFGFVHEMSTGVAGEDGPAVVQQAAQDLARIGVNMETRPIPWPQFVRGVQQGDWSGQAFSFEYETLPTGDTLRPFRLHSCAWHAPWYCDPAIEPAIAEAKTTFDARRRLELIHQILAYYRDMAVSLILFEPLGLDGLRPGVMGYDQANGIIPYERIVIEDR